MPGFKLLGSKTIACMPNGQYDKLPPKCERIEEEVSTTVAPSPRPSPTVIVKTTKAPTSTTKLRTRPSKPSPTTIRGDVDIIRLTDMTKKPFLTKTTESIKETPRVPQIIVAGHPHPQDNEIAGSSNVQHGESPNVNIPLSIDGERRETFGAKLNLGAIIALGAFGGFVFLAAIITTIIILVRRYKSNVIFIMRIKMT